VVVVNRVYPVDVLNFLLKNSGGSSLSKRRRAISRLSALLLITLALLALRFSVMGFSVPRFQPVDNPASFMDGALYRALNYNYVYCLNAWLLLCPVWLCFDWSMGCVPLITGCCDRRILVVLLFWILLGALIVRALAPRRDETSR